LAGQLWNGTTGKIELDAISTEKKRLRQLFAVYGCNGNKFFTTEFYNGTTANTPTANRANITPD